MNLEEYRNKWEKDWNDLLKLYARIGSSTQPLLSEGEILLELIQLLKDRIEMDVPPHRHISIEGGPVVAAYEDFSK